MVEWLPLELFDDKTFDDYSNEEWMQRQIDEDGSKRVILAKGLKKDPAGYFTWKPLVVESYDS